MSKPYRILRRIMLFWTAFIGIGAMGGGICMLAGPDGHIMGMQELLPFFQVLPFSKYLFQDFIFPGISLILVNGLTNLIACYLIFYNKWIGAILGSVFGFTLMLWITIQFVIFPPNILSTLYFVFGILQLACGVFFCILFQQSQFRFDKADYKHIGTHPEQLVVYFSRRGYCRKIAYTTAENSGAVIRELKTTEPTVGYPGFWWCGRFAMHRWSMPLANDDTDYDRYEKVTIVTPVWVFALCSPIREFCKKQAGHIRCADYVAVHFRKTRKPASAFTEMDSLLGISAQQKTDISCHFGRVIKTTVY